MNLSEVEKRANDCVFGLLPKANEQINFWQQTRRFQKYTIILYAFAASHKLSHFVFLKFNNNLYFYIPLYLCNYIENHNSVCCISFYVNFL